MRDTSDVRRMLPNRTAPKKKNKRPTKTKTAKTDSEQAAELIPEDILEESEQRN